MRQELLPETQINMTHAWMHEIDTPIHLANAHKHDYDEVLIWTGGDPEHPHELSAEIYKDIEGERHTTTPGSVYLPAEMEHCPIGSNRMDCRSASARSHPPRATARSKRGVPESRASAHVDLSA